MTRPETRARRDADEAGTAVVEFLGVTLVLLVPVVYLVLVLAQIQAAAFAVDGAAREAARVYVTSDADEADARALAAVALALQDQGLDPALAQDAVRLSCSAACDDPDGTVTAEVAVDVTLLGVPAVVADVAPLTVPVTATATVPVERFLARGGG